VESVPTDAELFEALQEALAESGSAPALEVRRRPSEYRTSFPLEELEVELGDGACLRLAFKRLGWGALDAQARLAKPRFLHDPRREPAVYAALPTLSAIGAPRYYGAAVDPERDRYWLFVEWVEGRELYQVGELGLWEATAQRLAGMHLELGIAVEGLGGAARLVHHDAAFYRRWMTRAREFARSPSRSAAHATAVEWLGERHDRIVEALLALPKTVIHGEFYASNVLVGGDIAEPRISPVDWELAAVGPGVTDLAALVSGGWSPEDRATIVSAYGAVGGASVSDIDLARLQLAIQWLGWAPPEWVPPEGQRHDWLGEALALAEGLGI
jgi:Ser/Thr protein kinase RdoA (MazF antagonist)